MKVKELIKTLEEYNKEANVEIMIDAKIPSSINEVWYATDKGIDKSTCKVVSLVTFTEEHLEE